MEITVEQQPPQREPERRTVALERLTDDTRKALAVEIGEAMASLATVGIVLRLGGQLGAVPEADVNFLHLRAPDVLERLLRQARFYADDYAGAELEMPTLEVLVALAGEPPALAYTSALDLRADQVDIGWLLLDARTETEFHPVTAVTECEDDHDDDEAVPFDPGTGPVPGYVAGRCGHRVAGSEWRAGFRVCERCPAQPDNVDDCVVVHSAAYSDGLAHCPADWTVTVRIPAEVTR